MTCNDRLHGQLFELLPALIPRDHLWVTLPCIVNLFEDGREAALVARIVRAIILHKVLTFLVDRIVGKVHKQVVKVAANRRYVVLRCEPRKPLLIDEDAQWDH